MNSALHLDILPEEQLTLFNKISNSDFIKDFYLAGGTGLALQIGHRQSIDFDFFIPKDFKTSKIIEILISLGKYERENEEKNTINGILNGVKVSFFTYKYTIIEPFITYGNITVAGRKDIAAMKLEAIAGRGSRKDFIDFYFMLDNFTIKDMLAFHKKKYGSGLSNQYHLLKSLIYFNDAEEEAMPVMLKKADWEQVKEKIIEVVKRERLF